MTNIGQVSCPEDSQEDSYSATFRRATSDQHIEANTISRAEEFAEAARFLSRYTTFTTEEMNENIDINLLNLHFFVRKITHFLHSIQLQNFSQGNVLTLQIRILPTAVHTSYKRKETGKKNQFHLVLPFVNHLDITQQIEQSRDVNIPNECNT